MYEMEIFSKTDIYLLAHIFQQKLEAQEERGYCFYGHILGVFSCSESYLKYLAVKRLKKRI